MPTEKGEKLTLLCPTWEKILFISLFTCACSAMSFMLVHVSKIRCFGFRWATLKIRYETSFENSTTFRGKFARTKNEFRQIWFAHS